MEIRARGSRAGGRHISTYDTTKWMLHRSHAPRGACACQQLRRLGVLITFLVCTVYGLSPAGKTSFEPADGICGDSGPWTKGICAIGSDGRPNADCESPCLVGEKWDELRRMLGTKHAAMHRNSTVNIKYAEWLSHSLMSSAFRIILQEILGYKINTFTSDSLYQIEEAGSDACAAVNLEVWHTEESIAEHYVQRVGSVVESYIGYIGREGLYISSSSQGLLESLRTGGKYSGDGAGDFVPDGTFGVEELAEIFPDSAPSYGCNETTAQWSVSDCTQGRWYPPVCGTTYPSPDCAELYVAKQSWSSGWYESVIRQHNLNFSVVYTGLEGMSNILSDNSSTKRKLFYWWEPDQTALAYPAVRLPLAEHSADCQDLYHYDPLLSGVNCDREILSLRKIMNARQWREEPDLAYLFQSWKFGNNDIRYLLKYHASSGGNYSTVESASCAWLKDHFDTWGPWVQISDPCGTDGSLVWDNETKLCIEPLSSSNRLLTAPVLSPIISAVVVAIAVFLLFMHYRRTSKNRLAPPKLGEPITIAITDIQGSTDMWESLPAEVMASNINLHHKCLRSRLKAFGGYEIATEGDSFKCAFHDPESAIMWAVMVQLDLLCAPWHAQVEDGGHELMKDNNSSTWADINYPIMDWDLSDALGVNPDDGIISGTSRLDLLAKKKYKKDKGIKPRFGRLAPLFPVGPAAETRYSRMISEKNLHLTVLHKPTGEAVPLHRGMRVRVGLHSGTVQETGAHEKTKRATYGGHLLRVAEAVANAPCGGQIVMSAEALASITSVQDLMAQMTNLCKDWTTGAPSGSGMQDEPGALSVASLGFHILDDTMSDVEYLKDKPDKTNSNFQILQWLSMADGVADPDDDDCELEERKESSPLIADLKKETFLIGHSRELIEVVPWPLRERVRYQPPPQTYMQVSPSWTDAPGIDGSPVTIVFVFVFKWKRIKWDMIEPHRVQQTKVAINNLVRANIHKHDGYEVEGEDCSFVISFHTAASAVAFGAAVQYATTDARWDEDVLAIRHFKPVFNKDGAAIMKGPRLNVGMCSATPAQVQTCRRTGRVEYFGTIMNRAARIAMNAQGGQTLLCDKTRHLLEEAGPHPQIDVQQYGEYKLKGVATPLMLHQATVQGTLKYDFKRSMVLPPDGQGSSGKRVATESGPSTNDDKTLSSGYTDSQDGDSTQTLLPGQSNVVATEASGSGHSNWSGVSYTSPTASFDSRYTRRWSGASSRLLTSTPAIARKYTRTKRRSMRDSAAGYPTASNNNPKNRSQAGQPVAPDLALHDDASLRGRVNNRLRLIPLATRRNSAPICLTPERDDLPV